MGCKVCAKCESEVKNLLVLLRAGLEEEMGCYGHFIRAGNGMYKMALSVHLLLLVIILML